jgi:hypothetical protein
MGVWAAWDRAPVDVVVRNARLVDGRVVNLGVADESEERSQIHR